MDDARLTPRPADAVVEHDRIVPGRRGLADDDPDFRQPGLLDQMPRAELLGIDSPLPADAEDGDDADVVVRPVRAAGRVALAPGTAAVLYPEQRGYDAGNA